MNGYECYEQYTYFHEVKYGMIYSKDNGIPERPAIHLTKVRPNVFSLYILIEPVLNYIGVMNL